MQVEKGGWSNVESMDIPQSTLCLWYYILTPIYD